MEARGPCLPQHGGLAAAAAAAADDDCLDAEWGGVALQAHL